MKAPYKIYLPEEPDVFFHVEYDKDLYPVEYIRNDALMEWVKLAYGKVSMNPFDCSEAFEELINKIESI